MLAVRAQQLTDAMREILGFNRLPSFSTVDEFERHLESLLRGGVYIFEQDGRRFPIFGKALVGKINGLRIEIFPREHAPPYFHVRGPDIDASFRIDTGLTVKDFHLLVRLKVFNTEQMNQAVFAFRRYEDASLGDTGIESHEGLTHYGLYDTVVARD